MKKVPTFAHPPIDESVLSVQFEELDAFTAAHFGLYFETIRSRFPSSEDQARLHRLTETFPKPLGPTGGGIQIGPPSPGRVWFRDDPKKWTRLIQLQPDRFALNWRQMGDTKYPSFDKNFECFREEFGGFLEFCQREKLGEVTPDLCEVLYVNRIEPQRPESVQDLFGKVFTGLSWKQNADLPVPDLASLNRVFDLPAQRGRLYAEATIGARADKPDDRFVIFKLTTRVKCSGLADVEASLHLAHDWVFKGFCGLTSLEIQNSRWGRSES